MLEKYKENELSNLAPTFRSKVSSKRGKTYDLNIRDKDELFKGDEKFSIATLDCDGNFNLFENGIERTVFNIYEIDNIDQEYSMKVGFTANKVKAFQDQVSLLEAYAQPLCLRR